MSWTWVWLGGALVLGFHLGVARMSLLSVAQQPSPERERGEMPCRARLPRMAGRHGRTA
jgi:hypothetical protein